MDYLFKKLTENIKNHDNVVIVTHRYPDLDGMSSAICLYEIVKSFKKDVCVVVPSEIANKSLMKGLEYLEESKIMITYTTFPEVMKKVYDRTLLVVLDTQKPELVQFQELLDTKDIFVIDHHINSSIHIKNTVFEYIDSNKSSVVEIMVGYLKFLNKTVCEPVATLMLTGMDIDTHSYSLKTTSRTFLAAGFLMEIGASLKVRNDLLEQSLDDVLRRNNYMKKSYFIKKGFILCDMGEVDDVVPLAILADELLRLSGVEVAFTVGKLPNNSVRISARSMGKISVNVLMNALGGGGHITDAAAEFQDKTNEEVIKLIKKQVMEV